MWNRTDSITDGPEELNQLWLYCFIWPLLQKISISVCPPAKPLSLCLKVTLPICQSLAMTLALSVIHHVGCVSARCRTSRAVGGLSGTLALNNMQIITCKLPTHVCVCVCVTVYRCQCKCSRLPDVCVNRRSYRPFSKYSYSSWNEKVTRSNWMRGRNMIVTHVQTHTHMRAHTSEALASLLLCCNKRCIVDNTAAITRLAQC